MNAATSHPSGSTGPAISYTLHSTIRHDVRGLSAGPEGDGWRRRYTISPLQCCHPGGTAIANHLDVHNRKDRRLVAFDAGNPSLRTSSKGDTCRKVIFGSLSVFGLVPFLFGPHLRPVSCLFQDGSPQKRKRAGRADQRRQATNPKSDQAQTQSDSHQQATGTAPRKKAPKVYFRGPIVETLS